MTGSRESQTPRASESDSHIRWRRGMDPRDFQKLAAHLVSDTDAAHNRTAIGRAYYAAFNVAAHLLRDAGFSILKNHTAHIQVTRHLNASENADVRRSADQLENLRARRNKADYDMDHKDADNRK